MVMTIVDHLHWLFNLPNIFIEKLFNQILISYIGLSDIRIKGILDNSETKTNLSMAHDPFCLPSLCFSAQQVWVTWSVAVRVKAGSIAATIEDCRCKRYCWSTSSSYRVSLTWSVSNKKKAPFDVECAWILHHFINNAISFTERQFIG